MLDWYHRQLDREITVPVTTYVSSIKLFPTSHHNSIPLMSVLPTTPSNSLRLTLHLLFVPTVLFIALQVTSKPHLFLNYKKTEAWDGTMPGSYG